MIQAATPEIIVMNFELLTALIHLCVPDFLTQ
jgi:hypothetical protein